MELIKILVAATALAAGCGCAPAKAATFPDKTQTLRIVVPFAAGGGVDNAARLLGEQLRKQLGMTVIVDNKAGASGTIGGSAVKAAAADGYTLLFSAATHVLARQVLANAPYDPATDFAPVARVGEAPLMLVISLQLPRIASANTFRSLSASRALGQAFGTAPENQAANPTLRVSNAVEYFLPSGLGGVYGALIVTAGESGTTANGFTKGNGFRLGWSGAGFSVAAAQFTTKNATGNRRFKDQVLGLSYDFGIAKLDVAQRRWAFGPDKTVNTQLGAVIPAGAGAVKLTYLRADQTGTTAAQSANDATLLGAGYVYNFSKRTALYGHIARVDNKALLSSPSPAAPQSAPRPRPPTTSAARSRPLAKWACATTSDHGGRCAGASAA